MQKVDTGLLMRLSRLTGCRKEDLDSGPEGYLARVMPSLTNGLQCRQIFLFRIENGSAIVEWPLGNSGNYPEKDLQRVLNEDFNNNIQDKRGFLFTGQEGSSLVYKISQDRMLIFYRNETFADTEYEWLSEISAFLGQSLDVLSETEHRYGTAANIRDQYNLLKTIIDNIPDPIYVKDLEGRKILLNKAEADILSAASVDEVIGTTDLDFYPPEVAEKTISEDRQIISTGIPSIRLEDVVTKKSGEKVWIEGNKIPFFDANGKVAGLVGISHNITRRKLAEQEIQENFKKYQAIFNSFQDLYYRSDLEGNILVLSPSVYKLSGYQPEDLIGQKVDTVYLDRGSRDRMIELLKKTGEINDYENILKKKDGSLVPVSITSHLHYDAEGRPDYIEGTIRDISERRAAQEKLQRLNRLQGIITKMATSFINLPLDSSDVAIRNLLELTGQENEVDRVYIFEYDFKAGMMSNTYEWCAEGVSPEIGNLQMIPMDVVPAWVETHVKGEMLIVEDVQALDPENPLRQILEPQGIRTLVTVPLIYARECLGFVGFDSVKEIKVWNADEIFFLQLLADLICNVTDRQRREKELRTQEAYLKSIFNNVPYQMWLKDTEGRYLLVNKPFLDYFSISDPLYPLGKTASDLWDGEVAAQILLQDKEVTDNRELRITEAQLEFHGKKVWFEIYRAPILDPSGRLLGTTGIARDVTKRILADLELKKATAAANAANEAKTRFLANMSHEIRTPLNAIIGMVRLLLESPLEETQRRMLGNMKSSSENLLGIINDILDFSKIESGQIELSKASFNLPNLIRKVYDSSEFKAEEKGIHFSYLFDPALGKTYLGDSLRLQQILNNLISNAIKFTREGKVEIKAELLAKGSNTDHIRFTVTDTGIGIDPGNQERIFKSFQQEDESITRTFGGTGLGLAISRQLVELMGGTLEVRSMKNQGSTFFFSVQLEPGEAETVTPVPAQEAPKVGKFRLDGLKVLMVEDNKFNQYYAQAILEKWGVVSDVAENGLLAVELLRTRSYDVILMDIQMPVMDGITAAGVIRNELGVKTPILALTANVVKGIVDRCLEAGMQGYVSKPFEEEELYQKIKGLLGEQVVVAEAAIGPPAENGKIADITRLDKMVGHDPVMLGMMIRKFLEVTPAYVQELQVAFESKDPDAISRTSHKIKSAIDLVASEIMRERILLINQISREGVYTEELAGLIEWFLKNFGVLARQLEQDIPKP